MLKHSGQVQYLPILCLLKQSKYLQLCLQNKSKGYSLPHKTTYQKSQFKIIFI